MWPFAKKRDDPAPEMPEIGVRGYDVRVTAGAAANTPRIARAEGRLERLRAKRARYVRNDRDEADIAAIDAAIERWEDQLRFSRREVENDR